MPSRSPYRCAAKISKDGKVTQFSPAFEYAAYTEQRKNELLAKEESPGDQSIRVWRRGGIVAPIGDWEVRGCESWYVSCFQRAFLIFCNRQILGRIEYPEIGLLF
jgi:hypothetical protein